jgi:hypothetical protein
MSDDETRAGFYRSIFEGSKAVDARFAPLAERAAAIISETVGERVITEADRGAIMARLDRELGKLYPESRGAPWLLESDIVTMCRRGQARAVKSALAPIMRTVNAKDPELAEEIRDAGTGRS